MDTLREFYRRYSSDDYAFDIAEAYYAIIGADERARYAIRAISSEIDALRSEERRTVEFAARVSHLADSSSRGERSRGAHISEDERLDRRIAEGRAIRDRKKYITESAREIVTRFARTMVVELTPEFLALRIPLGDATTTTYAKASVAQLERREMMLMRDFAMRIEGVATVRLAIDNLKAYGASTLAELRANGVTRLEAVVQNDAGRDSR